MRRRDYYTFSLLFYVLTYVFMTSTLFFISADNYQEQIYWDIKGYFILFALLVPSLLGAFLFKRSSPSETLKLKILSSYISLAPILALTPLAGGFNGTGIILLGYLLLYAGLFTVACSSYRKYTVFINMTVALLFMLGLTLRFGGWAWLSFAVGSGGIVYGFLKELLDEDAITMGRKAMRLPVVGFLSPVIYHALIIVLSTGWKGWQFLTLDLVLFLIIFGLKSSCREGEGFD